MTDQPGARDFWEAARRQLTCAVCNLGGNFFDAHHVVEKQWLKSRGLPLWDPRNALRLCPGTIGKRCHSRQTSAMKRVLLSYLTDENIEYAFEVQGAYAYDYLRRHYDGQDERIDRALRERGWEVAAA